MNFEEDKDDFIEYAKQYDIPYEGSFIELMDDLILKISAKIAIDIKSLFPTPQLQINLFASISNFGETKEYKSSQSDFPITNFLK
jgi:hypothetical protein